MTSTSDDSHKNNSQCGEGFCLLQWGEYFREGAMVEWSDACLAVLPVIAAHANQKGEAWPSYETICALARVSKTTVAEAVDTLVATGWIAKFSKQQGAYTQNRYRLLFSYNKGDDTRKYIALHHKLIKSGIWGTMTPSARRVYLILRAFAWVGLSAIENGFAKTDYGLTVLPKDENIELIHVYVRGKQREFHYRDIQFLPKHIYDPATFAELCGVSQRMFRGSMAWLTDKGLICPYEGRDETGFVIPFRPRIRFRHVLDALEKAKRKAAERKASSGAKRSFTAMLRRSALGKTPLSASHKLGKA